MPQTIIPNPVINSPFDEPNRHFFFDQDGITDKLVESRRLSSYFVPVPKPKKKGKQLELDTEWTQDRISENKFINSVRETVAKWRFGRYDGVTNATRQLLDYWRHPNRDRRLFFCQVEALETAIYLTEIADRQDGAWILRELKEANAAHNPLLNRIAFKMATGSGKTLVMAMLIAWHTLNKAANAKDNRFGDAFLIVAPGITIRDRLRVLLPNDPENYYSKLDIVPASAREALTHAKILITNYHAFLPREKVAVGKLTKQILGNAKTSAFTETPADVVRRVCRDLGNKRNLIVINDEAHHCYRPKPAEDGEQLKGEERREAEKRDEEARVWISGLEAVKRRNGVRFVYDLSATPFFLKGSGYNEGTLFPWVVSDFSLIDAIESGIVKVPRVPVADNSMTGQQPTYRDLWLRIREHLPRKGRGAENLGGEPKLPAELEGALQSLYNNYKVYFHQWEADSDARLHGRTPPVFIVVCNNTNVSKLVYDYISGWEKKLADGSGVLVSGRLGLFSNVADARWLARPNTILVDSEQLESGEAMSDDFRKIASREIEEFKSEYRTRFPERDAEKLTDEDILREVMNTVGKPDKLGEQVRCVVSVSMLTEGWDANTVTHVLGVRAFGTQLLCEQVVGRGLRRRSFALDDNGRFYPEYAEVYGVPFSFIPTDGSTPTPKTAKPVTRVRALEERASLEMHFPRLLGYRYDLPPERLTAKFTEHSRFVLSTSEVPTETENAPIVGESSMHTLAELRSRREQEIDFRLAQCVLETYFRDDEGSMKPWLFPELLTTARRWRKECLQCKDDTFPQMLLWVQFAHEAANRIYRSVVAGTPGRKLIKPILYPYDTEGSTRYVDFDTARTVYTTSAERCHISHVVADTESWEQKMAQSLESMDGVRSYFKNERVNFTIPYSFNGEQHNYVPDFVVRFSSGRTDVNLILEVSGENRTDKQAKVGTARSLWIPAVNNHGGFGRWEFLEVRDPWNAKAEIQEYLRQVEA
ncbi:MAG TPA: DEAD/DEAH box helicase family protein [Bryobacteraceae bacterium]|jgi:type III restriction enzyme|nr:DEAD/DEAH box helicase family protein [Bryobacteraceae bacterium]